MTAEVRRFPLMRLGRDDIGAPTSVPWEFLEPHENQALDNHGQTLKRLAERGGLDVTEALAVVQGRRWRRYDDIGLAVAELRTEANECRRLREENESLRARIADIEAAALASRAGGEWIAVGDRMPADEERVLFAYRARDGILVVVAFCKFDFASTHRWQFNSGQYCGEADAIAWQPLPAPPTESRKP